METKLYYLPSQAAVITVVIVKNQKCKIIIKNKIERAYSFDTFHEILCSCYDGMKDAETRLCYMTS